MVFSSVTFLFYFLPAFFLLYFSVPGLRAKNVVLLVFSLIFYSWHDLRHLGILIASIAANFALAIWIGRCEGVHRYRALATGVVLNILLLAVLKYSAFLLGNLNELLAPWGWQVPIPKVTMPLGVSFFTFHSVSYLVDVYRRKAEANRRLDDVTVYIAMFPQLVAGPIVRYAGIAPFIRRRRVTAGRFSAGMRIFVIGLAWKVLIADEVAPIADIVFNETPNPNLCEAWLGLVAYAVQIYFDFGGYSNMAIGLAITLGLRFPRNFRLPYGSRSITDFWRRWHMSLSSWFRDYVYIPLGGNRGGTLRTAVNLWTVFLLCGLWHGASWTFVAWGAYHGFFLVLERLPPGRWLERAPHPAAHAYALLVVLFGWVLFRSASIADAASLYGGLLGLNGIGGLPIALHVVLHPVSMAALVIGVVLSTMGLPRLRSLREGAAPAAWGAGGNAAIFALLALSLLRAGSQAASPFLYFQF